MSSFSTTRQAETFLQALADELSISERRYEQAEQSYRSLGDWLLRPASTLRAYQPQVYVQGSFRLGTVIRPISDEEDYDVDSVCELRAATTSTFSQQGLKRLLEGEVRAYHRAQNMTKPIREGRRCWVLNYADEAQFHMDVVPCVPDAARQRRLLENERFSTDWVDTAIAITDNERWNYRILDADWCRSNPKGYSEWFRRRMIAVLNRRKQTLAESLRASVESIPDYKVRTPLQAAIMILKRHRDSRFAGNLDDRPISIIITTLAAHAYGSEETIAEALLAILSKMDNHIQHDGRKYVIANPTDPLENFADKWETHPQRATAFYEWLRQARQDFGYAAGQTDPRRLMESLSPSMGGGVAERSLKRSGLAGFLNAASAAPAAALSFPNSPRVPTTPKGFA